MNQCFCHQPELLDGLCETHFVGQNITPLEKEKQNSQAIVDELTKTILVQRDRLTLAKRGLPVVGYRDNRSRGINLFCHRKNCNYVTESGIDMARHEADHPAQRAKTSETRLVSRACQRGQHNFCITERCACVDISCACANANKLYKAIAHANRVLEDELDGME